MFLDPIDAMQSRVEDVKTDITNKGAFTFSVVVKDRYKHRHAMRAEPMTFFFSQYGEIYPDNLWDFTPPVSPTLTPEHALWVM